MVVWQDVLPPFYYSPSVLLWANLASMSLYVRLIVNISEEAKVHMQETSIGQEVMCDNQKDGSWFSKVSATKGG